MHINLCIYVYLLTIWVYSWVEGDSTLLIVLMRKSQSYNYGKWEWEFKLYLRGIPKKGIEYDPFIDWYWSVIIISFIYQFIWTNKIAFCPNIVLSYEVNDTRLSPFRYQSMPIEAITPTWYMVVAMVGEIVLVTYWWSCVAYSGLLKVVKGVTGSCFSRLGRFNRGRKSARAWVWLSTSWVQSCRSYQWSY